MIAFLNDQWLLPHRSNDIYDSYICAATPNRFSSRHPAVASPITSSVSFATNMCGIVIAELLLPAWESGRRLNLKINRASRRLLSASKPLSFSPSEFECSRMSCNWAARSSRSHAPSVPRFLERSTLNRYSTSSLYATQDPSCSRSELTSRRDIRSRQGRCF